MVDGDLQYFSRSEFDRAGVNWFESMSERLLFAVDLLRYRWSGYTGEDARIIISPHPKALGRWDGPDVVSDHNIDKWGKVYGMDVFPEYVTHGEDIDAFRVLAVDSGITAIGVYPNFRPSIGFHLGVRPGRAYGDPATWGAVMVDGKQAYTTWGAAVEGVA